VFFSFLRPRPIKPKVAKYSAKAMTRSGISIQIQKVRREPIIGKKKRPAIEIIQKGFPKA
jgi:hypothetical protein